MSGTILATSWSGVIFRKLTKSRASPQSMFSTILLEPDRLVAFLVHNTLFYVGLQKLLSYASLDSPNDDPPQTSHTFPQTEMKHRTSAYSWQPSA